MRRIGRAVLTAAVLGLAAVPAVLADTLNVTADTTSSKKPTQNYGLALGA